MVFIGFGARIAFPGLLISMRTPRAGIWGLHRLRYDPTNSHNWVIAHSIRTLIIFRFSSLRNGCAASRPVWFGPCRTFFRNRDQKTLADQEKCDHHGLHFCTTRVQMCIPEWPVSQSCVTLSLWVPIGQVEAPGSVCPAGIPQE